MGTRLGDLVVARPGRLQLGVIGLVQVVDSEAADRVVMRVALGPRPAERTAVRGGAAVGQATVPLNRYRNFPSPVYCS